MLAHHFQNIIELILSKNNFGLIDLKTYLLIFLILDHQHDFGLIIGKFFKFLLYNFLSFIKKIYIIILSERYNEQLAIWLDNDANIGAISPSIIPAGTVTRRAVHKLWLVSTNAKVIKYIYIFFLIF